MTDAELAQLRAELETEIAGYPPGGTLHTEAGKDLQAVTDEQASRRIIRSRPVVLSHYRKTSRPADSLPATLETPHAEARRIRFQKRHPGVHIDTVPGRTPAASWCQALGAEPETVTAPALDDLLDVLEAMECDGCIFGIPVYMTEPARVSG
jgi:hypothetical protein